jgi:hypothetical protein
MLPSSDCQLALTVGLMARPVAFFFFFFWVRINVGFPGEHAVGCCQLFLQVLSERTSSPVSLLPAPATPGPQAPKRVKRRDFIGSVSFWRTLKVAWSHFSDELRRAVKTPQRRN